MRNGDSSGEEKKKLETPRNIIFSCGRYHPRLHGSLPFGYRLAETHFGPAVE